MPDDALPDGWTVSVGYLNRPTYRRKFGPIIADCSLTHAGRPRGTWTAGAILPPRDSSTGLNVTMRCETCATRDEAIQAAEKLATQMVIWIVGRAREVAGFGDAPAGGKP